VSLPAAFQGCENPEFALLGLDSPVGALEESHRELVPLFGRYFVTSRALEHWTVCDMHGHTRFSAFSLTAGANLLIAQKPVIFMPGSKRTVKLFSEVLAVSSIHLQFFLKDPPSQYLIEFASRKLADACSQVQKTVKDAPAPS